MSDKEAKKLVHHQDSSTRRENESPSSSFLNQNSNSPSSSKPNDLLSTSPTSTSRLTSQQQNQINLASIAPSPPRFVPLEDIMKAANGVTNM